MGKDSGHAIIFDDIVLTQTRPEAHGKGQRNKKQGDSERKRDEKR